MSIIGPRPLYKEFNNYYIDKHKLRISVKPGLTGLAQVKVRDSTDWFKKFNFDTIYVKKAIIIQIFILFKTFSIVFNSIFKKIIELQRVLFKRVSLRITVNDQ